MKKMRGKTSSVISLIMSAVLFVLLIVAAFIIPFLVRYFYRELPNYVSLYAQTVILLYVSLVPAFIADIALLILLKNIFGDMVFEKQNIMSIRIISWCCYAECIVFLLLGINFPVAFVIAFACAFIGTVVRVVKNTFETAAEIKNENDYTI